MKVEKLIKHFEILFRDSYKFSFAGKLKPTLKDIWAGKTILGANCFALSEGKVFVGDASPKRTLIYDLADLSSIEIRFMPAGTYSKNGTNIVRAFAKPGDTDPVFSIQIHPDNSLHFIENLPLQLPASKFRFNNDANWALQEAQHQEQTDIEPQTSEDPAKGDAANESTPEDPKELALDEGKDLFAALFGGPAVASEEEAEDDVTPGANFDLVEQILQLRKLVEQGILTEAEFTLAKAKLLE